GQQKIRPGEEMPPVTRVRSVASVDERQIVELEAAVAGDDRKALDAGHRQNQPVEGIAVVWRKIAQGSGVLKGQRQLTEVAVCDRLRWTALRLQFSEGDLDGNLPRGHRAHIHISRALNRSAGMASQPSVVGVPPDER